MDDADRPFESSPPGEPLREIGINSCSVSDRGRSGSSTFPLRWLRPTDRRAGPGDRRHSV